MCASINVVFRMEEGARTAQEDDCHPVTVSTIPREKQGFQTAKVSLPTGLERTRGVGIKFVLLF